MLRRLFTSESVTEGHPDKVCDQVSDAILDACLSQDKYSRVACETAINTGFVLIMGEITTNANVDFEAIARKTLRDIGYTDEATGISADKCEVKILLDKQSGDIAMGVDQKKNQDEYSLGAGDQGMMFGYACNETENYMPYAIELAQKLSKKLTELRKKGTLEYLRPDGKTQVTVEYDSNGKVKRIDTIVVSAQHNEKVDITKLRQDIMKYLILENVDHELIDIDTKYFINPTGRFVIGGPTADSGLTGRKIIVDTYGGTGRHGGGAFSGKDYTKVDRSAAYAARYVAKNIVAAGLADKCEIQLSYAIGVAEPISIAVETFGTEKVPNEKIVDAIYNNFDLRPYAIIETLGLRNSVYQKTASYGHFGENTKDLSWEQTNRVQVLKDYFK
ncbi:methionine adenosyltransferase [Lacrimispora algidixylanolytica]|uniref:S-adenosylmethionine synthase n=1 Tax=Lacrimispora algidixylanolytica TaxID=94868 RepID=A0A419SYB3_9FIRM|nr:methionine adenosyltransferase [Lacrimispora algidixylanolytica]RKD30224.1 methionine adenosyltransferase [Lacrimispora algidixylanolytica]